MLANLHEGDELHAEIIAQALLAGGNSRKLLVIMGIPASGKSTLCERLEARGAIRVNRDEIRKRLYGDAGTFGDSKQVNREYYNELRAAFATGKPVLSDNVNITTFHRAGTLKAAAEAGYTDITIVWVDVPLAIAIERNRKRDRHVPEEALKDMDAQLQKEGGPSPEEGHLLKLQNGADMGHYRIAQVRLRSKQPDKPAPAEPGRDKDTNMTEPTKPTADEQRRKLVTDLRVQVTLLDACIAAGRDGWAGETLGVIRSLSETGMPLFGAATTGGATDKPKAPARPKLPPPTPEEINEVLLQMIGDRPLAGWDGPLIALSFNGHLLTKEKAQELLLPLTELIKRAHVVFFQETNVDALRILGKAAHYGMNASHRNKREQACGFLFHPRLEWIGQAPLYHDYLLDVPGHPEYKETMRPALQRRVRDRVTGFVFDVINFHGKSNLGGPDQTRPTREWQFTKMMENLATQKTKSPWTARENNAPAPSTTEGAKVALAAADDNAWALPLGAVLLGGDYNAPIEKPETTEILPVLNAGFERVSTPDLRWSYQYKGNGGQFDGFFVRDVPEMVKECFIPLFSDNRRTAFFYSRLSDHMPVFMVLQPPVPAPATPAAVTPEAPAPVAAPTTDGDGTKAA